MNTLRATLADVAFSGSYNDLVDVPETFEPSAHTHNSQDIDDFEEVHDDLANNLLCALKNEIDLI